MTHLGLRTSFLAIIVLFVAPLAAQVRWPDSHQEADGRYDPGTTAEACARVHSGEPCVASGSSSESVAVTALVLLSRSSAGYVLDRSSNPFDRTNRAALDWLLAQQKEDGLIGDPANPRRLFGHAWALTAIVEMPTKDPKKPLPERFRIAAERALAYLIAARDAGGLWRVGDLPGPQDLAASGFALMALAAAKAKRIDVPAGTATAALALCEGYLLGGGSVNDVETITAAPFPGTTRRALTALAVVARSLWNGDGATLGKIDEAAITRLAEEPLVIDPRLPARDYTGIWLSTLALRRAADRRFDAFAKTLRPILSDEQVKDGEARGSFPAVDPYTAFGGSHYCSAMADLALEIWYRFPECVFVPKAER